MIAKKFRFHGYGSLKFAYSKGKMVRSKSISIKYVANPRRTHSRVAVVVSKKVTKKAPARNRIRRRLYEITRENLPLTQASYDIILTVFDEHVETMDSSLLKKNVLSLFKQAQLL